MAFDPVGTFQQRTLHWRSPPGGTLGLALLLFILAAGAGTAVYFFQHRHRLATSAAPVSPSVLGARFRSILDREVASLGPFQFTGEGMMVIQLASAGPDLRTSSGASLAYAVQVFDHLPGKASTSGAAKPPPGIPPRATRAIWLIRYLVHTHRTGSGAMPDGSKWGGSDAGAVDAANIGMAAFLLRPWLDGRLRASVGDVVRFEAERYLLSSAASGASGDSAAVSNAAAANILSIASCLYTSGQTRNAYQRRAEYYLGLVLTTYRDKTAQGNSRTEPTLFPDMTLQFNGNFSASAELQVIGSLARCALCYRLSGEQPPTQVFQNVTDCWRRVLVKLSVGDGWFLAGDGRVAAGGSALSWLATTFNDAEAQAADQAAAERITRAPWLHGDSAATILAQCRACDVAVSALLYGYFAPKDAAAQPLTNATLDRSLSGVTWLPAASLAVNRTEHLSTSFSWTSGAGQEWLLDEGQHLQWRFSPSPTGSMSPGVMSEGPAWSVGRDSFSTVGVLRLENGAAVQAAVYSLPGGSVILVEHATSAGEAASITLFKNTSAQEPDLFRDDERRKKPDTGGPRWANLDDNLGIVLVSGAITSLAESGVLDDAAYREVWPIMTAGPGRDSMIVMALYPHVSARETRLLAEETLPLTFSSPGWTGLLLPAQGGSEELVIGRFAGSTSNSVTLSSDEGAPVTVEEESITGSIGAASLSSPAGAAQMEPITCWLTSAARASISARQGTEDHSTAITNPSQETINVTAHYLSSGRPCTVTAEDNRTLIRLSPHEGMGEVHFYLPGGRSVMLKY